MDLDSRARVHHALADRHRLVIVDALMLGDRSPQELCELAEIPTNLLAHHLQVLEQAGLVHRRASSGDRRRRYVVLQQQRLSPIVPNLTVPAGCVLFVCTRNSARSQLAAALWRRLPGRVADSAGVDPAPRVHPAAANAARRMGMTLLDEVPKGYAAVAEQPALIVSVCDRAREAGIPFDAPTLHWSLPDPVTDGRLGAFIETLTDLSQRVDRLAAALPVV
jgi:protein-tyrosine-phosphatase/DNA-binding HxlR family transcriptional regulator